MGNIVGMAILPLLFGLYVGPAIVMAFFDVPVFLGQLAGLLLGGTASRPQDSSLLRMAHSRVERLNEAYLKVNPKDLS